MAIREMTGQEQVIVEVGGRSFRAGHQLSSRWWIHTNGLDDWWDSPDTRFDDDVIPGEDGAFDPAVVLFGARMFTFRGRHEAVSAMWAEREVHTWGASLGKSTDIGVRVYAGGRWLRLRNAKIRGRIRTREVTETITEFEFTIWAADPRKYGETQQIEIDALAEEDGGLRFPVVDGALDFARSGLVEFPGVFRIHNPGTAEYFPERLTVRGPLAGFTVTSESQVVEYDGLVGNGDELVLTPYAGGRAVLNGTDVSHNLIRADWVAVQPGETRGYLFTPVDPQPGSKLTVDHPEGAWW